MDVLIVLAAAGVLIAGPLIWWHIRDRFELDKKKYMRAKNRALKKGITEQAFDEYWKELQHRKAERYKERQHQKIDMNRYSSIPTCAEIKEAERIIKAYKAAGVDLKKLSRK